MPPSSNLKKRLQGKDLFTWIQQEAGNNGSRISPDDAEFLVKMAGDDLLTLSSEIIKMTNIFER